MASDVYVYTRGTTVVAFYAYLGWQQELVEASMLLGGLVPHAAAIKERAVALAPRSGREKTARRGGKSYAESFDVSSGVDRAPRSSENTRSGYKRAYARVSNTNHFALYIEYGNKNIRAHRVLRRAAGIITG